MLPLAQQLGLSGASSVLFRLSPAIVTIAVLALLMWIAWQSVTPSSESDFGEHVQIRDCHPPVA